MICARRANGFALCKNHGLPSYAEAFASAGYACIVFDYRRWGLSGMCLQINPVLLCIYPSKHSLNLEFLADGTRRNSIFVSEQLGDYRSVIEWVRKDPAFDADGVVLWGFSFSGA